jgi:sensor histidine kinase regulating citrate/malate metabolism
MAQKMKVKVEISYEENVFKIFVSDDGPGISADIRPTLFERGSESKSVDGVGLFLTKKIIEGCGGSIEYIDSKDAKGATFYITLPYA